MNVELTADQLRFMQDVDRVQRELINGCDGPATKFVVICRAVEMAHAHRDDPRVISEALAAVIDRCPDDAYNAGC